ncbi:MAG TPA: hypothetical protein VGB06_07810 [Solirubrobacterales bacterium]
MPETDAGVPQRYETRLKNALAHEIRVDMLRILDERPSSMRELAKTFDETLGGVATHLLELWKEGSLEAADDDSIPLVDRRFRLARVFFDEESWEALSHDERYEGTIRILEGIIGEAMAALRSGHLTSRADQHVTWRPVLVDDEGWAEAIGVLDRAFEEIKAIHDKCAPRLASGESPSIPMIVSIMGFERGGPRFRPS